MGLGLSISKVKDEKELVRLLAKLRLRSDFEAAAKGITEGIVDSFSDDEVLALPEATIMNIVDAYLIMHKQKVPEAEIFKRLDLQRSLLGETTETPDDINLRKYVKWRLNTEFSHLSGLEEKVIDAALLYIINWYSRTSKSEQDWESADKFAAKAIAELKEKYLIRTAPPLAEEIVEPVIEEQVQEQVEVQVSTDFSLTWLVTIVMLLVAGSYWLFFMGGLDVLLGVIEGYQAK